MTKRPLIALACAAALMPLAACNDGYGYGRPGYGPPPPPPGGGYYDDRGGPPPGGGYYDDRGGPPPGGGYRDDRGGPPPSGGYRDDRDGPPPGRGYAQGGGYRQAPPPNDDNATYYPERDYRPAPGVPPRALGRNDRVYRGGDGRYYCRRLDGTTGSIVGAVAGGVLGSLIDGGHNRLLGTLLGGGGGALLGRSIDQGQVQCR